MLRTAEVGERIRGRVLLRTGRRGAANRQINGLLRGMIDRIYNVLFLCTGNSARSVLAEAYLNHTAHGRFMAYSAGSFPTGKINPGAIEFLQRLHISTAGLRSKSWDEFARPGAPLSLIHI